MVELIVVVAIIILAAGLMTPTIADFFRNRELESIRGTFGSTFNWARLKAVENGIKASVVFFREGPRIYFEEAGVFDPNQEFHPRRSPLAGDKVWYELGFMDRKPSTSLPRYAEWEASVQAGAGDKKNAPARISIEGLPKVTFLRDGTLLHATGSDVGSQLFQSEIPENADIYVYQLGNTVSCAIDLRPTGQVKSKTVAMPEARPSPEGLGLSAEK
jgi:hypothetical protein